MNKVLLLIAFTSTAYLSPAQVNWQSVPVPNEAVAFITIDNVNTLYIGTLTYGVFKSPNDGVDWTNISAGLGDSAVYRLQSTSDNKVFASTASHGIYLYAAGVWTPANNGLPSANMVVADFAKGAAGTAYMMATSGQVYFWNTVSWTDITNNLPSNGRALATGPDGSLYAGVFAAGVFKYDGINNWTIVGSAMSNNYVTKVTVSASNIIYVACNSNNVFKCAATGGTWTSANTGLPAANMSFIGTDALNNVFTAPNGTGGAIYRSVNDGASWFPVTNSLSTTSFNCFAASPTGKVYTGASGIFKSLDGGNNWNDMNVGLHASRGITCFTCTKSGVLFAGTRIGPWRSTDNGATWQLKSTGFSHLITLQMMENAAGDMLCHAINNMPKGAIYRSTNNGDSWSLVAANGADMYTKLKQHKTDTIWATSRFSGTTSLSYSIDNGATWFNNPLKISAVWDIDFSKDNTIFLGSESEGVSRSDNGGQSFTLGVGNTIPWYGNVLEVETDDNGVIFAGGDWWQHTLWFSQPAENGDHWTLFKDPDLTISGVQDLVFDKHNNAYVACENNGIRMAYNTTWDSTTNWLSANTGLPSANASMLELGFDTAGYLYAVCYTSNGHDGGLFKTTTAVNPPDASIYTFSGTGNWSDPNNWNNHVIPPSVTSGNAMIIIDPQGSGEGILDVEQHVENGATLKVVRGKKLRILGDCSITQ